MQRWETACREQGRRTSSWTHLNRSSFATRIDCSGGRRNDLSKCRTAQVTNACTLQKKPAARWAGFGVIPGPRIGTRGTPCGGRSGFPKAGGAGADAYWAVDLTWSPVWKPEPETGAQTAEASSTSVALIMPMELVRRRMTAPVEGSLISFVTRTTSS